jgi:ubiquinone/menaquinone biosynthesis C-methylase UbiE
VSPLFDPALAHQLLDDPARDRWQKPEQVVRALGLRSGERVADIGAGSGYLLPHLSRAVGPTGQIYAEEVQPAYLPSLRAHAKKLKNVRVVLGTTEDPALPDHRIDCFVLLTVYHEVEKPVTFLEQLKRDAAPGARLAIIDFDAGRKGDPPAPVGHDVSTDAVLAEAQAAGWKLVHRHEFLSSQFFLVFERSDSR